MKVRDKVQISFLCLGIVELDHLLVSELYWLLNPMHLTCGMELKWHEIKKITGPSQHNCAALAQ